MSGQIIQGYELRVTTTGSAGSATGEATTARGLIGVLMSIHLNFHASAPGATTDTTITEVGGAGRTFLTLTNTATDGSFPVKVADVGVTGTALGTYSPFPLDSRPIKIALAQTDALTDAVVAMIYILE